MKKSWFFSGAFVLAIAQFLGAQTPQEKVETIAAEFTKTKVKEKGEVNVSILLEAKPDIRAELSAYLGKYEIAGLGHSIVFKQLPNGVFEAAYFAPQGKEAKLQATLKDLKVESGLLTATINHRDGRVLPFEGAFLERFVDGEKASSGLAIRHLLELSNGFKSDKAFYKKEE